jgi:hypothetical protein
MTSLVSYISPAFTPNISSNPIILAGIAALANVIPDMGAISSVNLLKNGIGTDHAKKLVGILKTHPTLKSLCGNTGNEIELDMSGKMHGAGDAIMLVPEVIDNGALTSLNMSKNGLLSKDGGTALGEMLKGNTVLKELDVSSSGDGMTYGTSDGPGFAKELAVGIKGNKALTSLNLADNRLCGLWTNQFGATQGTFDSPGMFSARFFHLSVATKLGYDAGIIALAGAIPDMRALIKLDISSSRIGAEHARNLQRICVAGGIELTKWH